ncbi:MAG: galactoside ABC transporter permease [Bacilli bacterium]|nr:galactoside ABC transporter permease [Bacilli bacterium]
MAKESILNSLESSPYTTEKKYDVYLSQLKELREEGAAKERALRNENQEIKLNRQLDKETKRELIVGNNNALEKAKKVKNENKEKVSALVSQALSESNAQWKEYYQKVCLEAKEKKAAALAKYNEDKEKLVTENSRKLATIKGLSTQKAENEEDASKIKENIKTEMRAQQIAYKSKMLEIKNEKNEVISKLKDEKFQAYMEKYGYQSNVRFERHAPQETLEFKFRHYLYAFKLKDFLLKNAIYFVLLAFFIFCIAKDSSLLSTKNIISIFGQSSTKLFYSLGVAGLILIAGTDLSIGRLTGASISLVCMIMSSKMYVVNNANWDFTGLNFASSFIIAILLSIIICVLFTSIAGFFTAKFKMHPFITTLSTQLISYGIMMVLFASIPAFNMEISWARTIRGDNNINLIIFSVIAIAVVWFIWNKTKFGKYMYAVGGNAEAASVSGINVFWVTMGIFIMAGVLYGLGGFFEATRVAVGNPSTGTGTELDAIAACVVGGISFSGGVGKVSGAVIGTLIFTALTYCLTYIGFDANMQFIFKGAIIMAAVCLDSLKYLKKK